MMNHILFVAPKLFLHKRVWNYIDSIAATTSDKVAVTLIDYKQKEEGLLIKRGRINIVSNNYVDKEGIDYFVKNKNQNVLDLIVIENYGSMSSDDLKFFEDRIDIFNKKQFYLIICSNKVENNSFVKKHFEVIKG